MRSLYDASESGDELPSQKNPFESVQPHELFPAPGEYKTLGSLDNEACDEEPKDVVASVYPLRLGRDTPLAPAF